MKIKIPLFLLCIVLLMCSCEKDLPEEPATRQGTRSITTEATYAGVALNMPDSVTRYSIHDRTTMVVSSYNSNTLKFVSTINGRSKLVELSEERILELNQLYGAVTDFSESRYLSSDISVIICRGGEMYGFREGCAKQGKLNRYIELLFASEAPEMRWERYPQEEAEREIQQFWDSYNHWEGATAVTTATPTTAYMGVALNMPDHIVRSSCYSSALDLSICAEGFNAICFYTEAEGEKIVTLNSEEVKQLNTLYESITDFSNLPTLEEGSEDVTLSDDGISHQFCSILTTQVELEQYLKLLYSYYTGTEYDWSVEPRD